LTLELRFGRVLRQLRTRSGVGIKTLAPELGVSYTYLSKLENSDVRPSEGLVRRVAKHFECDRNELLISAGHVPPEVLKIFRDHPREAMEVLRERFPKRG
jgi:HTH-type transcriptional regulator, competence development regulator